jgi:hypothetical protein
MLEERWDSGKLIAMGAALVVSTALVTGVVVGNWNGKATAMWQETRNPSAATSRAPVRQAAATPPPSDIEACNQHAKSVSSGTPSDVIEQAVIGGAIGAGKGPARGGIRAAGALYGLNETNQKDARAVVAYRACMRERGHTN